MRVQRAASSTRTGATTSTSSTRNQALGSRKVVYTWVMFNVMCNVMYNVMYVCNVDTSREAANMILRQ